MTDAIKTASERLDELLGAASDGLDNLPDDIMQAALLVAENLKALERDDGSNAISIARAIAAERERCANICEVMCRETLDASDRTRDILKNRSYAASSFSLAIAVRKIRDWP